MAQSQYRICNFRPSPISAGTVKVNIRYGRLDATDEEIIEATKMVNAHDFIMRMEHGYDTEVGEGGNRLSTGENSLYPLPGLL